MKYWEFSEKGDEFFINHARLPRHWYNYLWNEHYVALFSHLGQGYSLSQDKRGNRIDLVSQRMLFIRDMKNGHYWSANSLPVTDNSYQATHGMGYSVITLQTHGIQSSFCVFVPQKYRLEIWSLTVENLTNHERELQFFPFMDTLVDGPEKAQNYYLSRGYFDDGNHVAIIDSECAFDAANRSYNWLGASGTIEHFDTRQSAFIGYGSFLNPDALEFGSCTDSEAEMHKPILALETHTKLGAGETQTMIFFVGSALSMGEIKKIKSHFLTGNNVAYELKTLKDNILTDFGAIKIDTPNHELNSFLNFWIKRQIFLGIQWARVRHNGYRDLMQDIATCSFMNPEVALKQFKRVLACQYPDGHAPRTFIDGKILDKDFADNHVWIIYTAHNLVLETGSVEILDQMVDFNDGSSSTIFDHLKRALEYLWNDRGVHGLSKIHSGDWNDGLDRCGHEGKGVSVWLTFAFLRALRQFGHLSALMKKETDPGVIKQRIRTVEKALDSAREDNYFIRAIDDHGKVLGSKKNTEATFFLNTQSWAVISGKITGDEAVNLLEFCDKKLMTDIGILSVENAFTQFNPKIAMMSRKTKGIQENGGVYLHSSAFKLIADAMARRCDAVEKGINLMLPFDKNGEPFVFPNGYYAIKNSYRYGESGQSWCTGTAAWFYYAILNYVLGIKPTMTGLMIDPCLPVSWNNICVIRPFRDKIFHIDYSHSSDSHTLEIFVDGKKNQGNIVKILHASEYHVRVIIPKKHANLSSPDGL